MEDSLIHLTARESPGFQAGRAAPRLTGTAARAGAGLLASVLLLASTCAFAQAAPAALSARAAGPLVVKSEVIENEDHYSVFGAAFSRGLRFVLALPDSAATKSN